MESKLAKALYDNTAECSDELAFHKGDVVTVMEQNVEGTSGWWMCSLYGRQGLAPANRLQLLPLQRWSSPCSRLAQKAKSVDCPNGDSPHNNIYQIPSALRPPAAAAAPPRDGGDLIYKVPSTPLNAPRSPLPSAALKFSPEGPEGIKASISVTSSSHRGEVYDIPNQARRTSLYTASTAPRQLVRKASLSTASELERRFSPEDSVRCSDSMYAVPPAPSQDPSYDIPVPSSNEAQQRMLISGYNTLPTPRKPEWIYDVPVSPEQPGSYGTMPSKVLGRAWPAQSCLYDIPKAGSCLQQSQDSPSPPTVLPRAPVYSRQPAQEQVYAVPPHDSLALHRGHREHVPLECRGEPTLSAYDHARVHLQRTRKILVPVKGRAGSVGSSQLQEEEDDDRSTSSSSSGSQRSSTSSTTSSSSSSSSCDSLALSSSSSSSPEPPMRQVTLGQGEAGRRLLDLQEGVCRAAPRLMEFVSSRWRRREHLEEHLDAIREAAEAVACSLTHFVNFALDVKGNACRLTDANLQARIHKQLSVVADSGVILQQTVNALGAAGWPLDALSQDPAQAQTPDQLERFVMVARTVPEDVKRLVSILNANGKLLFRPAQTETSAAERPRVHTSAKSSQQQGPDLTEVRGHVHTSPDPTEDDNDYVQLQTKSDYETQQKKVQGDLKENTTVSTNKNIQADQKRRLSERRVVATSEQKQKQPSLSEHCRLYFGALQKAIGGLVGSLLDSQPPERFISHSKLVIMVGQRLVDTLCREAHNSTTSGSSSQSLLCKSNHLCALLKQLAVATKKAALHYPDRQALLEAQDFATELAQRAQHFRISLDL